MIRCNKEQCSACWRDFGNNIKYLDLSSFLIILVIFLSQSFASSLHQLVAASYSNPNDAVHFWCQPNSFHRQMTAELFHDIFQTSKEGEAASIKWGTPQPAVGKIWGRRTHRKYQKVAVSFSAYSPSVGCNACDPVTFVSSLLVHAFGCILCPFPDTFYEPR